jgi:hypothetical protein
MPATTAQFLSLSPPRKWSVKKNKKGKRASLERDGANNIHGSLLNKLQSRRGGGSNLERCNEKRRSSSMSPQPLLSSAKSPIPSSPDMTLLSGDTALLSVSFSSDSDDDKKSDVDVAVDAAANNDNIFQDSANAIDIDPPPADNMCTEKIESPNNNVDDKISAALDLFLTKCQKNRTENRSNKLEWAFLVDAIKEKNRQSLDPLLGKVLDGNINNEEKKERGGNCNENEEGEEGQSMSGKSITSELSASTTDWVDFPPQLFRSTTPRQQKTISGDHNSIIETIMPWDDADDQVNSDDDARKCLFGDDDNDLDCYGFVIGSVDEETIKLRQENELLRKQLEKMSTATVAIERQDSPNDIKIIEKLQNKVDELKEELSLAKERLEVAAETNIAINDAHDRKAEECEDLQREVKRLTELVQEKNRLENAAETNKALNEAHDEKHKECEELKSDIGKFADSFAAQHDNLQQLERRVSKLASENEELKASNRILAKRLNKTIRTK